MDNRVKRLLAVTITVVIGQAMPVQAQSEHKTAEPANVRVTAAPSEPTSPWQPPDLSSYASTLKPDHSTELVAGRPYTLPELIDIAERRNPATRVAWERASAAASALGLVKSEYYPVLAMGAGAGIESTIVPLPEIVLSQGSFRLNFAASNPELILRWLLVDFGRRSASVEAAQQRLLAANLGFNAEHERIVFAVQRNFYELASVRGQIAVAEAALKSARTVQEAAETRLANGLATLPDVSLARVQAAQAAFDQT